MFCTDCAAARLDQDDLTTVPAGVVVYRGKTMCLACFTGYINDANGEVTVFDQESTSASIDAGTSAVTYSS